jgi:periplasmic protein TonB
MHCERRKVLTMFGSPKRSALLSGLIHAALIVAILAVTKVPRDVIVRVHDALVLPIDVTNYRATAPHKTSAGGGGGTRDNSPASYGQLPQFKRRPFVMPEIRITNETPILPMEPALVGDPNIKVAVLNLPIGLPNGVRGPASNGEGSGGGAGNGKDGGFGDGKGPGAGPGDGPGGGVGYDGSRTGGSVVAPVLLWKIDPEYSEDARKAKVQGTVFLRIEVDASGHTSNISVRQGMGLGLDQKAMDAVSRWKFRPGTVNGKPVPMIAFVDVSFRLL